MRDAASISQSRRSSLTSYNRGVRFFIKTVGAEYEVDRDTAEKLAAVLLNMDDTKFVKVQTVQAQVVLNVSSIMAVFVDESVARRTLTPEQTEAREKQQLEQDRIDSERLQRFYEERASRAPEEAA